MPQISTECLEEIFKYLENDHNSLFSCLLVEHSWSRIVIPILWSEHWEKANGKLIETYIACLDESDRDILLEEGVDLPDNPAPLYNYPRYLKKLDLGLLEDIIYGWLTEDGPLEPDELNQVTSVMYIICKLIIDNCDGLYNLEIGDWKENYNIPDIAPLKGARSAFVNLRNFQIHGTCNMASAEVLDNISNLLTVMTHFSNNIQSMKIDCCHCDFRLGKRLCALIESQSNLQHLLIEDSSGDSTLTPSLNSAFSSQFSYLKNVTISGLPLDNTFLINLANCKKLELLNIFHCRNVKSFDSILHQIEQPYQLPLSKFACLHNSINTVFILDIFEMSKNNLSKLILDNVESNMIEFVGNHCKNLEYLAININPEIIKSIHLLTNLNIKYFNFYSPSTSTVTTLSTDLLKLLGLSLPLNLDSLDLDFSITPDGLYEILNFTRARIKFLILKLPLPFDNIVGNYNIGVNDEFLNIVLKQTIFKGGILKELRIDRGGEFLLNMHFSKEMLAKAKGIIKISPELDIPWSTF
ncbi:3502_t:CDS:1 [Scutellospora calospora]|uniref:3502_t:CDS:1 n=1 Tax=Scutellospora calospora TaxID=85575 RepID=A0ACA9L4P4_9GLOM|nr:3502_t:CDS:1 [Scutellospora calospora]